MTPEAIEAASKLLNKRSEAKKMLERELDTDDEILLRKPKFSLKSLRPQQS